MNSPTHPLRREDRLPLLLSFLIPIVIMVGIFAGKGIFPFGENCFLRTDLYHQYAPFFAEFARILKSGGSLTYSFEIGLGSNFTALFAYYLSSPFNWLLILVPSGAVIEFITYLIVLKMGLCGLTMSFYLKSHFHENGLGITFFGVCYAMSGYLAAYSWNIMWLDCLWLAPLVLLGVERLVREDRPLLYCLSLALAILTNYYIAIMLCIFVVLYFLCEMILLPRRRPSEYGRKCLRFAAFSLIGGGLAAVLIVPAACALMTTASADTTFPTSLTSYFSVLDMLARQLMNVETEIGLDHWPNLYSGVACLLCFPAYILNRQIPAKEKIVKGTLLMVMLLSFSLNIPNYIWHGMHYPNSLPCRQSFLYTIVLLTVCYEGLRGLRDLTKGQIAGIFCGAAGFIFLCQEVVTSDEFDFPVYYLSLLFTALYALLAYLWKTGRMIRTAALSLALCLLVAETGINMATTSVTTTSRTEYWQYTDSCQSLAAQAAGEDESGFFRIEKTSRRSKNDAAWIGFDSASLFSSTTEAAVSDFYRLFGMEGNTNAYCFNGATPLAASLLSVRYLLSPTELEESDLTEFAGWEDTICLYRCLYTMNLGFMIPDSVDEALEFFPGNPAEVQNTFVGQTTGSGIILQEIARNDVNDYFLFVPEQSGHLYVYVENPSVCDVTAFIGDSSRSFENVDRGYFLDLGFCEAGEEIELDTDDGTMSAVAYRFDEDVFRDWYEQMSRQNLTVESCTNSLLHTSLTGRVTAAEGGTLFLSIPYDEGWTIRVDGEEAEASAFADTFLSVDLGPGTHEISLTWHVVGLRAGVFLSLLSLLLVLLAVFFLYRKRKNRPRRPGRRGFRPAASLSGEGTDPSPAQGEASMSEEEIARLVLENEDFVKLSEE